MLELKREQIDLVLAIQNGIEIAKPFVERRQQAVTVTAGDAVFVSVDPIRVAQIIGNLLHNASKYTPVGGQIHIELVPAAEQVEIRVIDTGAGIPASQLARVFDMFTKIERSVPNANSGLGIGLALAQRLAVMHGGHLTASSPGECQGSTFTLILPVAPAVPAAPPVPEPAPSPAAPVAVFAELSIVVVEDNDDAADMMGAWLESLGHQVQIARSGPDGLALVQAVRPDVVLCDIGLPGMDGVEVCRRINELQLGVRPIMIALTGWGMDADRQRTAEAGFRHHLVKPVALDKLREILRGVPPR
jgi:CheY-like chemotaxis protein